MSQYTELDQTCVNSIRVLAADTVEKAKSGHPGMPMGSAAMAYVLWTRILRHNPRNPQWPDRDRFILSAGHGSALLYSLLHLSGYDLALEDLQQFRQWGSRTPGHPEYGHTIGVETTTGPLGQGLANAVGMAMAERFLAARFNKAQGEIVDHYTYALVGDGCLMEGVTHEAASLAGTLKLGKLICLYDDNHISIEGSTDLAFTEDTVKRFEAYGWQTLVVEDGNDLVAIDAAIRAAQADQERPSFIAVRTEIGYGSPHKQGKASAHGEPLGADELQLTKQFYGWPHEPFHVPAAVQEHFRQSVSRGAAAEQQWNSVFAAYAKANPVEAGEWSRMLKGELPAGWEQSLPRFAADAKGVASRVASGDILQAVAAAVPNLIGGSADLAPSTKTLIKGEGDFSAQDYGARNLRFGVREHAMGAIMNGLALHGGLIAYGATFLVFADYMRPAIRLAALMKQKVIYIFTHDSIGLGEDGPTHQPVEHLASLRLIPGLTVLRPADANETAAAWKTAMTVEGPAALILSRQNLPTIDSSRYTADGDAARGAYAIERGGDRPDLILLATGSEVHLALTAAGQLRERGISARVVSMPSWEIFESQPAAYREAILPAAVTARVAVEAGVSFGWSRYTGEAGVTIGIDRFGASAPAEVLFEKFGFTAAAIVEASLKLLGK
ncbi:MAG: transketolase [Sporomusaceae bacterium]|nr:transketolase [Sporomusaceae bacterium]